MIHVQQDTIQRKLLKKLSYINLKVTEPQFVRSSGHIIIIILIPMAISFISTSSPSEEETEKSHSCFAHVSAKTLLQLMLILVYRKQ